MSLLLREIRGVSQDAAAALQKAGFVSDTDIRSLTRQDLNELIPGPQHLRQRKTIGDIIQNAKPIDAVLRELLDFIPDDCVKAALAKNGVLNDYLVILRDMKTQVENVHSFLEAHIGLFEEYAVAEKQEKARPASLSVDCAPVEGHSYGRTDDHVQARGVEPRCAPVERQSHGQGSVAAQSTVRVKAIVKGQTFDCHRTLLQRVRQLGGLHVEESDSGPTVVIVFCPVKTRHMTDIEAAMEDVVPGEAAVILVVMHHTHDVDYPNIVRSLGSGDRGWDFVNVLYHETVPGLLTCAFNEQAVAQLRGALLKHSSVVSPVAATAGVSGSYRGGSSGKTSEYGSYRGGSSGKTSEYGSYRGGSSGKTSVSGSAGGGSSAASVSGRWKLIKLW